MKREAILKSTLVLISELGIHNTPMSKIARHAGVATGTIYHHFNSKEEILNELYLSIKKEFGSAIEEAIDPNKTVKENFYSIATAIYQYYTHHPLKFIFSEQITYTPILTEETRNQALTYYQAGVSFYEENIRAGKFQKIEPYLMGQLIYASIKTLVHMHIQNPEYMNNNILQQGLDTAWRSIAKT